ncbi:DUF4365 domain-containing protein [Mesorhizobium sp. M0871]|uniref:DUF4365 domain-containing protein n=1 Tax=unclassified Mesorhizobium TaxID=325217 RepID=UPI0003CE9D5B|nr:DUF4365 domain-containing protein [Mesorhizobium sp. LSHC412B00]ESX84793.1 hypothetical protein X756_23845 [Mesorhizobium sp. LSHC412B00]
MSKKITDNQLLGEIGETAARLRFLKIGFQFDVRSRLEAGVDGIVEVMDNGVPLAKMIAVQVKARHGNAYASEDKNGFTYMVRSEDLEYWRPSNLPVIIVLYRDSDETFFWKEIPRGSDDSERRLRFDKKLDCLDTDAVDRLAAITVPKAGFGYYIPPLGGGEFALVNMLPITFPPEMYVAPTTHSAKDAGRILLDLDEPARFDWVMKSDTLWSFQDPRKTVCREIVELDQVEAIDTRHLAFHEDVHERNVFAHLLRRALGHQFYKDLGWDKDRGQFYFKALAANASRSFSYKSSKQKASSYVVNVAMQKADTTRVSFVRHHSFIPRFENLMDEWFLVVNPNYYFTTNGFQPHSYPAELLAGKKRLDNSASLRGQLILWHRFLTRQDGSADDLFAEPNLEGQLKFGEPPEVYLATKVPEDAWGTKKAKDNGDDSTQAEIEFL